MEASLPWEANPWFPGHPWVSLLTEPPSVSAEVGEASVGMAEALHSWLKRRGSVGELFCLRGPHVEDNLKWIGFVQFEDCDVLRLI